MAPSPTAGRKRVSLKISAKPGSEVYVAGSFNDWNPTQKQLKEKNGAYEGTLFLPRGRYEYKFVVDGNWQVDPECEEWTPNDFGSLNSVLVVN